MREFYITIVLDILAENFTMSSPEVVRFRLMGKSLKLSITGFNLALGLFWEEYDKTDKYFQSGGDYPEQFEPITLC